MEGDRFGRCKAEDAARGGLPQTEVDGTVLRGIVAVDGHIDIACIGFLFEGDVASPYNLVVDNSRDNILGIGVVDAVQNHLTPEGHLTVESVEVKHRPWALGFYLDIDFQRFGQSVFIGKIDDFGVGANGDVLVQNHLQGEGFLGLDAAVRLVYSQPVGLAVDVVLVAFAAYVSDLNGNNVVLRRSVGKHLVNAVGVPDKGVLVDIHLPHDGVYRAVAIQVLDIADGEIDVVLVDFAVEHVDIDHEFVIVERPVEVNLGQQVAFAYGGMAVVVGHGGKSSRIG